MKCILLIGSVLVSSMVIFSWVVLFELLLLILGFLNIELRCVLIIIMLFGLL